MGNNAKSGQMDKCKYIEIFIKSSNENNVSEDAPLMDVKNQKNQIQPQKNDRQSLSSTQRKFMEDKEMKVEEQKNGSLQSKMPLVYGGIMFPYSVKSEKDIKNTSDSELITCVRGLSLEGNCKSESCQSYLQKVVIPKGFGNYNLILETENAVCPLCKKMKENFILQFYQCRYIIQGRKKGQDNQIIVRSAQTEVSSINTFPYAYIDKSKWEWLNIDVKVL